MYFLRVLLILLLILLLITRKIKFYVNLWDFYGIWLKVIKIYGIRVKIK